MGKKIILVIEDDRFLSRIYFTKLTKEGFEVVLATEGEEAMRRLQEKMPDLILLDLVLPIKSGFEILEEIKQSSRFAKIPVVIFSNLGQQEDMDRGKRLGAADYFVKANMNIQDVVDKIKKYLAK
ncbi:response regulator [Candidatus Uhrbacteria bacterium]|nr:response regulator [Candidatus Uhrbacteria bacterium]